MKEVDEFLAWLKSKNINSHVIVGVIVTFSTLFVSDQDVRDFVSNLFHLHPKIYTMVVALAAIIFKYSHSTKPTVAKPIPLPPSPIPVQPSVQVPDTKEISK